MVEVKSNVEELKRKFERWARVAPEEVRKTLLRGAERVRSEAKMHHLSGPKMPWGVGSDTNATLRSMSGRLRNSIATRVMASQSGQFSAQVGTNIKYAKIHEFGGIIRAKAGKWLMFPASVVATHYGKSGKRLANNASRWAKWNWVKVKQVKIPARPFLRPSLEKKRPEIFRDFGEALMKAYGK